MDREPEQLNLGALGLAGICRETFRVVLPDIIRNNGDGGIAVLSVHVVANRAFLSLLQTNDGSELVFTDFALRAVCLALLVLLSLASTATYVFRVASFHCTHRIIRNLPRDPLSGLVRMILHVIPPAMAHIDFAGAACLVLLLLDPSNEVVSLPLRVIGAAVSVAAAAYVSVVLHIACVVSVLQGAVLSVALRKSRALLAGKFWTAAAIFVPLDVCFVALQTSLLLLVLEDKLGLGREFRLAAGAVLYVALWAVVVVTLVAQPAMYLVCKNNR